MRTVPHTLAQAVLTEASVRQMVQSVLSSLPQQPAVGGFPAAYLNPCSHAPVVLSQGGDGFYRKQGSLLRPPY